MKHAFIAGLMLMLFTACASEDTSLLSPEQEAHYLKQSQQATQALGSTLKQQLTAALKSGGPVKGIEVCHRVAPALATQVAAAQNVQIRRVSLKTRNPANQPDAFERQVLEKWQAAEASQPVAETFQLAAVNGQQEFRYLKPIRLEAACLQCHGPVAQIKPEVKVLLQQHYPADQATGYQEGELRGAFSVRIPLAAEAP